MSGKLVIVDISGWVFQAFYSARNDNPAQALRERMLGYAKARSTTHFVIAMDAPTSFRRAIFPPYKSQRPPKPEGIPALFEVVRETVRANGIQAVSVGDYEADDVIASAATMGAEAGLEVEIHSPDKDILALVQPNIAVSTWRKKGEEWTEVRYDVAGVIDYIGVRPQQVPDWLAIAGDSVDGIPGVQGVGPVAAAALLSRFGDIDGIMEAPPYGAAGKRVLNAHRAILATPQLPIYRKLATLARPDLGIGLDDMRVAR
jgi:DNA polymerase-1